MSHSLRINEIFYSIQGEARFVGLPTIFVRLTGCPLRCHYCDTAYAFHAGKRLSFSEIFSTLAQFPCQRVCVTGGEPLAQPAVLTFMHQLCESGYAVSIETSGALDIQKIDSRVCVTLDLKTPGSGEAARNLWSNLSHLKALDQVKLVITDREDFDWACQHIQQHALPSGCEWLLSPMTPGLDARVLAEWLLQAGLPENVRLQVQLHKQLWHDAAGH